MNWKGSVRIATMAAFLAACSEREMAAASGFQVRIAALREDGAPVPAATIELRLDGDQRILRTDAAGRTQFELAETPLRWNVESIDGCPVRSRETSRTDQEAVWELLVSDSTWIPCHRPWIAHVQGPRDTLFTWRVSFNEHSVDSFGSSWRGSRTESVFLDDRGKADLQFDGWLNPFRELPDLTFEVAGFRMARTSVRLRPSDTTFLVDWKPMAGHGITWWNLPWTCGSSILTIESDSLLRWRGSSESSSRLLATIAPFRDSVLRGRRPGTSGDSIRWVVHVLLGTIDGISVDTGNGSPMLCRSTEP